MYAAFRIPHFYGALIGGVGDKDKLEFGGVSANALPFGEGGRA